jgi:fimbrial chaperone protein
MNTTRIKQSMPFVPMMARLLVLAFVGLSFVAFASASAWASNFRITPTALELSGGAKSGAFSIINSDTEKLNCQIDVKEWSQDADGKDVYTETKDIVFFPKIMTVEPNEQRSVRVGIKGLQSAKEKTYRLFAEEIPSQKKTQEAGSPSKIAAGLTIAFRYATPIFVKPARPQESGIMDNVNMTNGLARALVKNAGNVHFKLLSVKFRGKTIDGKELFSQDVAGWYVLQGMTRSYEATVPKEVCKNLATIEVTAQAENFTVNGTLNVQKNMCTQ